MRIYLTPKIAIQGPGGVVADERLLPGRQGRVALAVLVLERAHPITKEALAEHLWPEGLPPSWPSSLSAIASKIRSFLVAAGADSAGLTSAVGCYQCRLPTDVWVDVEAAFEAQHSAETLTRKKAYEEAWGISDVAYKITRRPFLPGAEGEWIERMRRRLRDTLLRSIDVRCEIFLWNGEPQVVATLAEEALDADPFRETAYRWLIRAHLAVGSRAEAVLTYERCRELLARELGVEPSTETMATLEETPPEGRWGRNRPVARDEPADAG